MLKKALIALAISLLGGLIVYVIYFNDTAAPNVVLTSLSGQQTSIKALQGKMILVNFWATSCPTCVEEMPKFKHLYQRYAARGLETIAVAMQYDSPQYVQEFTKNKQLPFFVVLDSHGTIARAFGNIQLTPTTFIIDTGGNIIQRYIGTLDMTEVQQLIDSQLG